MWGDTIGRHRRQPGAATDLITPHYTTPTHACRHQDPHQDPHHPPKADPPTTVTAFELEGASSAAAAIPVPCACLPLSLGKPAYQHRRVDEGTIRTYMRAFGDRSMSYVHFHRCQKHYEVRRGSGVKGCLDAHAVVPYHRPLPFVSSPPHPTRQPPTPHNQ